VGDQLNNNAAVSQGKGAGDHLIERQTPKLPFMIYRQGTSPAPAAGNRSSIDWSSNLQPKTTRTKLSRLASFMSSDYRHILLSLYQFDVEKREQKDK
jgi:hypothetical protein